MTVLVTGGTGFIGSHLVEALVRQGIHVRCLLRRTSDPRWLKALPVELMYGDCRDESLLGPAVRGVDQVFHLAGATKARNEAGFLAANVRGTENLLAACLRHAPNLQRFIFLSSQAAAGPGVGRSAKTETDPSAPVSPYGRSKHQAEQAVLAHRDRMGVVILRPCAIYGPRDRDVLTVFRLVAKKIKFCIAGMEQRVSLCYIDDLINATLLAGRMPGVAGETFFISDGREYRMDEIGETFARVLNVKAVRVPVPKSAIIGLAWISEALARLTGRAFPLNRNKAREMVQANWLCDIGKARRRLMFDPQIDLGLGSRLTVEWYRQERWL